MDTQDVTPAAALIHNAIRAAVRDASASQGGGIVMANDIVEGLIESLASFVALSPFVETIRGKREFLEGIAARLKERAEKHMLVKSARTGPSSPLPGLGGLFGEGMR